MDYRHDMSRAVGLRPSSTPLDTPCPTPMLGESCHSLRCSRPNGSFSSKTTKLKSKVRGMIVFSLQSSLCSLNFMFFFKLEKQQPSNKAVSALWVAILHLSNSKREMPADNAFRLGEELPHFFLVTIHPDPKSQCESSEIGINPMKARGSKYLLAFGRRPRRGRSPLISSHMDVHSFRPYIHTPPQFCPTDGRAGGRTE
jgi:hypothetical protein